MKVTLSRSDAIRVAVQYDDETDSDKPIRLVIFPSVDLRFGSSDFDLLYRMIHRANNRVIAGAQKGGIHRLIEYQRLTRNARRKRERDRKGRFMKSESAS